MFEVSVGNEGVEVTEWLWKYNKRFGKSITLDVWL